MQIEAKHLGGSYGLNVCVPPKMMVLGGGAFGRCLGHEGGALVNEIGTLIKETPETSPASSIR